MNNNSLEFDFCEPVKIKEQVAIIEEQFKKYIDYDFIDYDENRYEEAKKRLIEGKVLRRTDYAVLATNIRNRK